MPVKPGLHSYNLNRRIGSPAPKLAVLHYLRLFLVLCGLGGLGYYGYTLADQHIYQAYENWSFDRHMAGHPATFEDWLRERTPLGTFMKAAPPVAESARSTTSKPLGNAPSLPPLQEGALLGRVSISRLNLSAIVRQGVDEETLSRAVGHVPSTAFPGQEGNFAIAAHRDTLFRALKDIKQGDDVTFQSTAGNYRYRVISTQIVVPSNISVLKPPAEGGWLTMITCYPFYYVGSAPKRFIVQAKLVSTDSGAAVKDGSDTASARPEQTTSPPHLKPAAAKHAGIRHKEAEQASLKQPRHVRGFAGFQQVLNRPDPFEIPPDKKHKRGFWHRLFHHDSD